MRNLTALSVSYPNGREGPSKGAINPILTTSGVRTSWQPASINSHIPIVNSINIFSRGAVAGEKNQRVLAEGLFFCDREDVNLESWPGDDHLLFENETITADWSEH
jgi:hypothetical protein